MGTGATHGAINFGSWRNAASKKSKLDPTPSFFFFFNFNFIFNFLLLLLCLWFARIPRSLLHFPIFTIKPHSFVSQQTLKLINPPSKNHFFTLTSHLRATKKFQNLSFSFTSKPTKRQNQVKKMQKRKKRKKKKTNPVEVRARSHELDKKGCNLRLIKFLSELKTEVLYFGINKQAWSRNNKNKIE